MSQRWTEWIHRLENLFVVMDIKDDKRKRALILHYGEDEMGDLFGTMPNTGDD